jgi:dTDP-4-dehydrorhamnose 3,5-epimerase
LRGFHVHVRHRDYLSIVSGRATVGLKDLRRGSPTEELAALVPMAAEAMEALVIPPGVAHGFLFHEPSLHVYAVSHAFDPADELGCRWDDPDLGLDWPSTPTLLSPRDEAAPSLRVLREILEPYQPFGETGGARAGGP